MIKKRNILLKAIIFMIICSIINVTNCSISADSDSTQNNDGTNPDNPGDPDEPDNPGEPDIPVEPDPDTMLKLAILNYNYNPSNALKNWIDSRFKLRVQGHEPTMNDVLRMDYLNIQGIYAFDNYPESEYLYLKDWAKSKGIVCEEMFVHAKLDYTFVMGEAFDSVDKFGMFENIPYAGVNGVLKYNGISYDDLSVDAYESNQYFTLNQTIYIGYEEPFMKINMEFQTFGVDVNCNYEYYNGSTWASMSAGDITDETNIFTQDGTVMFKPASDWNITSVNNSREKYFIRLVFNSAATDPINSRIFGDNWNRGSAELCRGWDNTNVNVNTDNPDFSFNMNPPSGASAHFPYQARVSFWSPNHFIANPADRQYFDGENQYTWVSFIAEKLVMQAASNGGYAGMMCDDSEAVVGMHMLDDSGNTDTRDENDTDFIDKAVGGQTWEDYNLLKYELIVEKVHQINPNVLVGANVTHNDMASLGDWNLVEFHTFAWKTKAWASIGSDSANYPGGVLYDDYLPGHISDGSFSIMIYADNDPNFRVFNNSGNLDGEYDWDRANRGPIAALTKHYIAMNEHTYFTYHSHAGFWYPDTDEVYLTNGSIVHRATHDLPNINDVDHWGTYFPAMGVNIGIPDVTGYNQGERDLTWKSASEVDTVLRGGTARGRVWRRDYTNAIILHRPGRWNSSRQEYDTPSTPIDLGGVYYPLRADGKTLNGIYSISLKINESAILMKYPVY